MLKSRKKVVLSKTDLIMSLCLVNKLSELTKNNQNLEFSLLKEDIGIPTDKKEGAETDYCSTDYG